MSPVKIALLLGLLFCLLAPTAASAEPIDVFTSGAPAGVERAIWGIAATTATGDEVRLTVANLKMIQDRLASGERPDLVILPRPAIEALDKAGALLPGSRVDLARVGIGVIVKNDALAPDIATEDALRRAMQLASSVVYPDPHGGGFTGAHIDRVIDRLGVGDEVRAKATYRFAIGGGVSAVANGQAALGVFNISEVIGEPGVRLAGPLPASLQHYIAFSGAVLTRAKAPDKARKLLETLEAASGAWAKGGFERLP